MEEKKTMCAHRLSLDNRQEGTVTGVRDIHSFNESVRRLNLEKGEADIEGKINSLTYLSKKTENKEESLLKRMFR